MPWPCQWVYLITLLVPCGHTFFAEFYKCAIKLCCVGNFSDTDIGEPIVDVILEPGDLLYFPRGTIHQVRDLVSRQSTFSQQSYLKTAP